MTVNSLWKTYGNWMWESTDFGWLVHAFWTVMSRILHGNELTNSGWCAGWRTRYGAVDEVSVGRCWRGLAPSDVPDRAVVVDAALRD